MKTIERAHMPSKLWERIKLSEDYARSLEQIDERLLYWPKYLSHKCKQRMTRLAQVALRSRRLAKEDERMGETIVGKAAPKVKRREATRERKALAAAKLEKQIEKELIERLRSGAYGEAPLNVEEGIWKKVLRGLERGGDAERDVDEEEEMEGELEDEEDYDEDEEIEYVSGDEELEEEAENDLNDIEEWIGSGASDFEDDDDEGDSSDEESDDEEEAPKGKKGPVAPVDPKKRKRDAPAPKSRKRNYPLHTPLLDPANIFTRRRKSRDRIRRRAGPPLRQGPCLLEHYFSFCGIEKPVLHHFPRCIYISLCCLFCLGERVFSRALPYIMKSSGFYNIVAHHHLPHPTLSVFLISSDSQSPRHPHHGA